MFSRRVRRMTVGAVLVTGLATGGCACGGPDGARRADSGVVVTDGPLLDPTADAPSGAGFSSADARFATDLIRHHSQALNIVRLARTRTASAEVKALADRISAALE